MFPLGCKSGDDPDIKKLRKTFTFFFLKDLEQKFFELRSTLPNLL